MSKESAILSIRDSMIYLGKISRGKLYSDVIPHVVVVRIGGRVFITRESLDEFILKSIVLGRKE